MAVAVAAPTRAHRTAGSRCSHCPRAVTPSAGL